MQPGHVAQWCRRSEWSTRYLAYNIYLENMKSLVIQVPETNKYRESRSQKNKIKIISAFLPCQNISVPNSDFYLSFILTSSFWNLLKLLCLIIQGVAVFVRLTGRLKGIFGPSFVIICVYC